MRRWVLIAAVLVACAGAWWWRSMRGPNILLITVDTLRPDYVSSYGGTHGETPNIDALAASGVLFTQAVCDVPWTRASMASVMTGRYAAAHRVRSPFDRLISGGPTLAERLRAAGYRTGAVVSVFDLDHIFELDRGFTVYDDRFSAPVVLGEPQMLHIASIYYGDVDQDRTLRRQKLVNDSMRSAAETTDAALGWLRRVGAHRFFLWVHYFGARERWSEEGDVMRVVADYPKAVAEADREVGRLLNGLVEMGLARDTLMVLHADHGQALLENGRFGHGYDLTEVSARVPLIISWPGHLPSGRRVSAPTALVDILPTIAELARIDVAKDLDGRSLVGLAQGHDTGAARDVYLETFLSATSLAGRTPVGDDAGGRHYGLVHRGVRSARWKYIRTEPAAIIDVRDPAQVPEAVRVAETREELYDLQNDPWELTNVIAREAAVAATLRGRLDEYLHNAERGEGGE